MHLIPIIWLGNFVLAFFDKTSSNEVNSTLRTIKYSTIRSTFCAICTFIIFLIFGDSFYIDAPTIYLSLAFGILMTIDLINYLFLAKTGMIALMSISNQAASLLIPSIAGIFLFSIPVNPLTWVFVATLLVSAYLLCSSSKEIYTEFSSKTVIMLLIRFFVGGTGSLVMQSFARIDGGVTTVFLLLSYIIEALLLLVSFLILKKVYKEKKVSISKRLLMCAGGGSVSLTITHTATVVAAAYIAPVIMFSSTTVGVTVGTAILGAIFFNEKLTLKSVVGIAGACISVLIINMLG